MTTKELQQYRARVAAFIDNRQLRNAISEIKSMAARQSAWSINDRIEKIEQAYAYMLQYMVQGSEDPERDIVYDGIVADLYSALDSLVFSMRREFENSQYFSLVRLYGSDRPNARMENLISEYAKAVADNSLFSMLASESSGAATDKKDMERLQSDLFAIVWATPSLSSAQAAALMGMIDSDAFSPDVKSHILSALMLAQLQCDDARKTDLQMQAYMRAADAKVKAAALVGLLLSLWRWRERPLTRKTRAVLAAVKETDSWASDLQIACIELIRTFDTARINKKISDELLPEMMNLRPEILNKINNGVIDPSDMSSLQENPEWEELLHKNGITDKLKELSEEQMQGADVMMSTFSHLKSFPFFNDISNWFLPFSSAHSQVAKTCEKLGLLGEMVENATFFCDSDKYSFMFAIDMVPQSQRDLMTSQFKAQSDSIYEAMGEAMGATAPEAMRKAVNSYLQTIYRFFKLYRRKDEFFDPFADGVNLVSVPALASDFADENLLQVIAEFYFKYGYMADALNVFERLDQLGPGDAQRYQKMGYACEKKQDFAGAIARYRQAELLDAKSVWTMRRLASCYRAVGDKDRALEYYEMLERNLPEDAGIALMLGYVLLERDEPARALHQFYKVDFLDEKSHKAWRPLAWTLFLTKDFDGARKYYDRIAADRPTAGDYLNMGHVALASGRMADAVESYRRSGMLRGDDHGGVAQAIKDDAHHLAAVGVDTAQLPLVIDAVLYAIDE